MGVSSHTKEEGAVIELDQKTIERMEAEGWLPPGKVTDLEANLSELKNDQVYMRREMAYLRRQSEAMDQLRTEATVLMLKWDAPDRRRRFHS